MSFKLIKEDTMNYFIVMQNKTYEAESKYGYIWAPKNSTGGRKIFHWENMTKVKKGDIIFNVRKQHIYAYSIAKGEASDQDIPEELDELWQKEGRMVQLDYIFLENEINTKDLYYEIKDMLPSRYSPYDKLGGFNQGYLYELPKEAGEYIMNKISESKDPL
jgi:hypothetical protein